MELCVGLGEASCPNLRPLFERRAGGSSGLLPVYCRLPNGRVRVPTRDELASLCLGERYPNCPGYRRWARSGNASGGDS